MKTASILLSLALAAVSVQAAPRGGSFGGFGQGKQGQGNTGAAANNAGNGAAAASTGTGATAANSTGAAATASNSTASADTASTGSNSTAASSTTGSDTTSTATATSIGALSSDNIATNATADSTDAQSSLLLDSRVIATGFLQNGQNATTAAEGQVASLTSNNNFINYCLTQGNTPITNGLQITTGSCNPAPIGTIPSTSNMPSTKFSFPANGGTVTANQAFTISMNIQNIETGNFVNAEANYFAAPQQLNSAGQIIGHTHVVVEAIPSVDSTALTNPQNFAFFKGIDAAAVNGVTTANVTAGLPAGAYRLCSITSSANHQPAIVAVAQHGNIDDCVYFTSSDGSSANATAATGADAGSGAATASADNSTAAAGSAASSTDAATAAASSSAATGAQAANGQTGGAQAANGQAAAKAGGAKAGKGKRMMYSRL
jgi:hypothetical protein